MDFLFNDDEQMVHDMCTRFAREVLAEAGAKADRAAAASLEIMNSAIELGLFIDAVPVAQGGYLEGDFNHRLRAVRTMALAAGCPGLTLRFEANTEFALAAAALQCSAGMEALTAAPGRTLACTALQSELNPLTVLHGTISGSIGAVANAAGAAWYLLVSSEAATEPFVAIVDGASKGLSVKARDGMALRAAAVGDIHCTQVATAALMQGSEAARWVGRLRASYRILAAALATGAALQGLDYAEAYAADRVQFGQPIGTFESLARLVHENRAHLQAARYLTFAAAHALDCGQDYSVRSRQAAEVAGQCATRAAIDAVQIYGGYGFVNDYPVEKIMRDARACTTLAGDGLQELVVAQCA